VKATVGAAVSQETLAKPDEELMLVEGQDSGLHTPDCGLRLAATG